MKSPVPGHTAGPWRNWHLSPGLRLLPALDSIPAPASSPGPTDRGRQGLQSPRQVEPPAGTVACPLPPLCGVPGAGGGEPPVLESREQPWAGRGGALGKGRGQGGQTGLAAGTQLGACLHGA